MSDDGIVRTEIEGRIMTVEIDRYAKRNAFTPELLRDFADTLTRFDDDDDLWVAVVTFAGDHMTAGLELPRFGTMFVDGTIPDDSRVDPFGLIRRPKKPVVMAVQGAIYTVGIELVLAADIVVAADSSIFCQLEPRRGLAVFGGAAHRYVERAGWGNAMYHLLRSDKFDAERALRLGFVQEVVPHGTQKERAMGLAREVAQCAPKALQWIKHNASTYVAEGERAAIAMIPDMMRDTARSADAAEGVRAFFEKRDPVFSGH